MTLFKVPTPINEPVKSYAKGTPERADLEVALKELKSEQVEVPLFIGGKEISTGNKVKITSPHDHNLVLGSYCEATPDDVTNAIDSSLKAYESWSQTPWEHRAAIFLRAADLLAGPYRAEMNAATMLAHSKNIYQAEIDAVCELVDFLKFNAYYMQEIYQNQPGNAPQIWDRTDHRPLEGFVFSVTPFNFISISANLATAPASLGNVIVWKPSETAAYTCQIILRILKEAGLPDGVINMVLGDGPTIGEVALKHKDLAAIHFTGSTATFQKMWQVVGANIANYRTYPRIVGETGGKDFIIAHDSANQDELVIAMVRGSFEYQGQKCSASSRSYIPKSFESSVKEKLIAEVKTLKVGSPENYMNFVNAVIDERAFDKITGYIDYAKTDKSCEIIVGGDYDKSKGYFINPTVVVTTDPNCKLIVEEIFGPVLTIYFYDDDKFEETLELVDTSTPYALTGAVFAIDREAVVLAEKKLRNAAGNFYINDKPTGAVVGQQPFGGGRASGTNDKAGGIQNMLRWVSPRSIKETFVTPKNYRYPFMS